MSEKIGGAKGTELDDEFLEMEKVSSLQVHMSNTCICVYWKLDLQVCVTDIFTWHINASLNDWAMLFADKSDSVLLSSEY